MGDRALVLFRDEGTDPRSEERYVSYSPAVYLHWNGSDVPELLKAAAPRMRAGDQFYAAARFCGYCHEQIPGNLSLGLMPGPEDRELTDEEWESYSHGDNGVFIVDASSGKVEQKACYGKPKRFKIKMGADSYQ